MTRLGLPRGGAGLAEGTGPLRGKLLGREVGSLQWESQWQELR